MSNYIKQVKIDLWNSIFQQNILFKDGLNLISGTNGTGKTQILNFIHANKNNNEIVIFNEASNKEITVFSPKRNAEKQLVEQVQISSGLSKQQKKQLLNSIKQQLNDANFQTINSIAFYLQNAAQILVDTSSKTRDEATNIIKEEYQTIFDKLFNYKLVFSWDSTSARPHAGIIKNGQELSFTNLSAGENALLSLVCAIYFSKEDTEVYLIDEPEVHLNWSLEEKLFEFLDSFCVGNKKQIIAVTHSRIIAIDKFIPKTKFFYWENQKVVVSDVFTPRMLSDIAGDTIKIIQGITSKTKIVYVEDESQKTIFESIIELKKLDIQIQIIQGGCEYVKSISKAFKDLPINNIYFVIDGDNKPILQAEINNYKNLIQLSKYCIENYLLNKDLLSLYKQKDWDTELKILINEINKPHFKPVQVALEKSASIDELIDYVDGSEVFIKLAEKEKNDKKKKYELMKDILAKIPDDEIFEKYFIELKFLST